MIYKQVNREAREDTNNRSIEISRPKPLFNLFGFSDHVKFLGIRN